MDRRNPVATERLERRCFQPVPRPAERVRQDDIRSCLHEGTVQFGDPFRMFRIPQFGRIARPQAAVEQVTAGRAVREQPWPFRQ